MAQAKPTAHIQAVQREVKQGAEEEPLPELTQEGETACSHWTNLISAHEYSALLCYDAHALDPFRLLVHAALLLAC